MSLRAARGLHLALILVGALLYLIFVLPRWWVLTGDIPTSLATAGRLVAGIPIALAALPVLTMLRQALGRKVKPPEVALRLRAWSAVLHVIAGALILLAAVAEIWLHLGAAGPYLFAVYGAAASVAILAVLALYLSFVAEKPPAEPKPPKPPKEKKVKAEKVKAEKTTRGKKKRSAETAESEATTETVDIETVDADSDSESAETVEAAEVAEVTEVTDVVDDAAGGTEAVATESETVTTSGLRNKRPEGKKRRLLGR